MSGPTTTYSAFRLLEENVRPVVAVTVETASGAGTGKSISYDRPSRGGAPRWRVLRKFRGFIVEPSGEEWTVAFVDKGQVIEYTFPAETLKKHGISFQFQPFEMEEIESTDPEVSGVCYRYRPLAESKDVFLDHVELDSERQRLRQLILEKTPAP